MRTLLTSSRLPEVPPRTNCSDQRKDKTVECVLSGPPGSWSEFVGEEKVANTEQARQRASQEETNPGQGREVVIELSEDEGGSALPPLRFS